MLGKQNGCMGFEYNRCTNRYTVDRETFALQKFHVKNLCVRKISNTRCVRKFINPEYFASLTSSFARAIACGFMEDHREPFRSGSPSVVFRYLKEPYSP